MEKKSVLLFKTKNELLLAEERNQLVLDENVKKELNEYSLSSLLGATVTKNSPGKVVSVELVDSAEKFMDLAF